MQQVLTEEEYEELTDILAGAEEFEGRLSSWERGFVADFQARADKWERKIRISEKQWLVLRRIQEKL